MITGAPDSSLNDPCHYEIKELLISAPTRTGWARAASGLKTVGVRRGHARARHFSARRHQQTQADQLCSRRVATLGVDVFEDIWGQRTPESYETDHLEKYEVAVLPESESLWLRRSLTLNLAKLVSEAVLFSFFYFISGWIWVVTYLEWYILLAECALALMISFNTASLLGKINWSFLNNVSLVCFTSLYLKFTIKHIT